MNKDKNILVLCGGYSTEREVSLRSGQAVYNALRNGGYQNVELFDFKRDNMMEVLERKPDVVYLALHGEGGEDGCIQGMLEMAQIPYTGPGVAASAVCMNKITTKQVLSSCGIPTAKFVIKNKKECTDTEELTRELVGQIGLPMVLKAPCQGSSIGVVLVKESCDIPDAIDEVFKYGDWLLAEEFLSGVELTLPILGNEELTVLPEVEIASEREFYDYSAKYTQGMSKHIIPARIEEGTREEIKNIGKAAYTALGCVGVSRIDFIVDDKKGPMVIEVNTLPGMTETSLLPDSAKHAGMSFEELVSAIVELGFKVER